MHSKIHKGPKNTDQICCFNPFWRNFLFILSSCTVFGDSFYMYYVFWIYLVFMFNQKARIQVRWFTSFYFLQISSNDLIVYHKIWTLRRFFYTVNFFYMDCIVNKYIFFNLYVHSHLKYTHLIKSSLKYI